MKKPFTSEELSRAKQESQSATFDSWNIGLIRQTTNTLPSEAQLKFALNIIEDIRVWGNKNDRLEKCLEDFEKSKHDKGLISGFIKLWNEWYITGLNASERKERWNSIFKK